MTQATQTIPFDPFSLRPARRPPCSFCRRDGRTIVDILQTGELAKICCDTCDWSMLVRRDPVTGELRQEHLDTSRDGLGRREAILSGGNRPGCAVPGCPARADEARLCDRHHGIYKSSGAASVDAWLAKRVSDVGSRIAHAPSPLPTSAISDQPPQIAASAAERSPMPKTTSTGLLPAHYQRWLKCGRPPLEQFKAAGCPTATQWRGMLAARMPRKANVGSQIADVPIEPSPFSTSSIMEQTSKIASSKTRVRFRVTDIELEFEGPDAIARLNNAMAALRQLVEA